MGNIGTDGWVGIILCLYALSMFFLCLWLFARKPTRSVQRDVYEEYMRLLEKEIKRRHHTGMSINYLMNPPQWQTFDVQDEPLLEKPKRPDPEPTWTGYSQSHTEYVIRDSGMNKKWIEEEKPKREMRLGDDGELEEL